MLHAQLGLKCNFYNHHYITYPPERKAGNNTRYQVEDAVMPYTVFIFNRILSETYRNYLQDIGSLMIKVVFTPGEDIHSRLP